MSIAANFEQPVKKVEEATYRGREHLENLPAAALR
jgi:hypothetical protein